jgi:hypothetical protein
MKKTLIVSAFALATLALGGGGFAQDDKAPKDVTGEVIDLNCYMGHEAHGADHKACGVKCAKGGNPIGMLTADGKVYLLLAGDQHEPASAAAKLIDKMAETATVTGKVIKRGGLEAVIVDSVK